MQLSFGKNVAGVDHEDNVYKVLRAQLQNMAANWPAKEQFPSRIFFSRWALANKEGRHAIFLRRQGRTKSLNPDQDAENRAAVWLYTFPDNRADYLIERVWKCMGRQESQCVVKISFASNNDSLFRATQDRQRIEVTIPKLFLSHFKGSKLATLIEAHIGVRKVQSDANQLQAALKLRYNKHVNRLQQDGITMGMKAWAGQPSPDYKKCLDDFLNVLYRIPTPLDDTEKARRFLFMWQNLSIIFSKFTYSQLDLYFYKRGKQQRSCLGLFWNKSPKDAQKVESLVQNVPKLVEDEITAQVGELWAPTRWARNSSSEGPTKPDQWDRVKTDFVQLLKDHDLEYNDSLEPLMRLAGELAFSQHEGRPCEFNFIAGTERIFPVVSEVLTIDFFDSSKLKHLHSKSDSLTHFDPALFKKICTANYSLFQVPRVVGFYNVAVESLTKILRLQTPDEVESRLYAEPVIDNDDLFCWAIERICRKSNDARTHLEESEEQVIDLAIVSSSGAGKIRIYVPKAGRGELLALWKVAEGKIHHPLGERLADVKSLREVIMRQLGIEEDDPRLVKVEKSIRKVSANVGQGAALILARTYKQVEKYLVDMEFLLPGWLRNLGLDAPQYLLHAALITDGACLITPSKVFPRKAIYPFHNRTAWGLSDILSTIDCSDMARLDVVKAMSGKGSKTHGSANLSTLPNLRSKKCSPEVVVISISADGPIALWPDQINNLTIKRRDD